MSKKIRYSSGAEWEDIAGYSRGVRVDNIIEIAGTTAVIDGEIVGKKDIYLQTITILGIIKKAIEALGGSNDDIIRTRMYVTDITQWEKVARAHGEIFRTVKPASTMVEVSALIDPDLMIEIEASAYVNNPA